MATTTTTTGPDYEAVAARLFRGWQWARRGSKNWWARRDAREPVTDGELAALRVLERLDDCVAEAKASSSALLDRIDEVLGGP